MTEPDSIHYRGVVGRIQVHAEEGEGYVTVVLPEPQQLDRIGVIALRKMLVTALARAERKDPDEGNR